MENIKYSCYLKLIKDNIILQITNGIYLDEINEIEIKDNYIAINTNNELNILINNKPMIKIDGYYITIVDNIKSIIIDDKEIDLNFNEVEKDLVKLLENNQNIMLSYIENQINDLSKINILKYKISKIKRFCKKYDISFNNLLDFKLIEILKKQKQNNKEFDNYYLNEVNKIIKNYKIKENKLTLSLSIKNINLYQKLFTNFNHQLNSINTNLLINHASLEQYFSYISHINWFETLQEHQITSIIIRTKPNQYFITNNNIDCIDILNITRSTIDLDMLFSFFNQYYNKYYKYDDGIGEPIFKGNGLGEGNCAIPIFIHPEHWKLAIHILPFFTGMAVCGNPGLYIKNTIYIYQKLLLHMISSTYIFNIIDEKWINILFSLWITNDKLKLDTYDKDEFIKNPLYRIQIQSLSQIIYKVLEIDDDKNFNYLILEEIIRRTSNNNLKYIQNIILDDIILNLSKGIKVYNTYLISANIFKQFKYMKDEFIKNNCVLTNESLNIIKTHITEYKKYFIDQEYYSFDTITKLYNESFNQYQIQALIFQCIIQERDKNRSNAIKKNKYYNPFEEPEKVLENCIEYINKYITYNIINFNTI
jgi:hypothetical protein